MKSILLVTITILSSVLCASAEIRSGVLPDPRPTMVRKVYSSGKSIKEAKIPYIIVAWDHPPKGSKKRGYQIWGNGQILDKETLEMAVQLLMQKSAADIYIVGNNWAAGSELNKTIQDVTKKYKIDAYFGSPYGFTKLDFRPESKVRSKMIAGVIEKSTKTEQGSEHQSTTRSESKSE